MKPNLKV
jgi:type IV secretory pathway VirB6-like protein